MGKYLLWAIVILVALLAARIIAHRSVSRSLNKHKSTAGQQAHSVASESMVRCEHCGIHMPQSEAMQIEGHTWCSQEHARLGVRDRL